MRRILTTALLLSAAFIFSARAFAQPVIFSQPLSPRIANYDIDVKLDAAKKLFHGKETLTWHNKTGATITELQFHLYLNAFRNTKSSFIKEAGAKKGELKEPVFGFIEVESIKLASGEDLKPSIQFIHPDDNNADDRTVFRVPLPKPLAPGEIAVVNIDFTGKLPEPPMARNGSLKEFFFFGQWFPKVGVYIDGKWNCHQYHSHTEFFSDFGVYNVKMTVPEKNLLGATGVLVSRTRNSDGTATHFYHAEDVHDFAWTTSPDFIEFTGTQNGVAIRALVQKAHKEQGQRHVAAAQKGIEYFEKWYGKYPYPNLTVVDPRPGAGEAGGMEYPTLITSETVRMLPKGIHSLEMVIIHEFGHQYWYHMVASNEFEESWMDEGINTYSEISILHDIYGAKGSLIELGPLKADDMQERRYDYVTAPDYDPIVRNGWQYYNGRSYGSMSYSKPGLMLLTLENYLGVETMHKVMSTYFEREKFTHAHSQDFVKMASEVSGSDLSWFFDQALYSNSILDYAVSSVSSKEVAKGQGYDYNFATDKAGQKKKWDAGLGGLTKEPSKDEKKLYETVVKVRRLGGFTFPVELEVVFENGEKVREKWDGKDTWKSFTYVKPSKLAYATVDPDKKIPMDINWGNNKRTLKQNGDAKKGGYFAMAMFVLKNE